MQVLPPEPMAYAAALALVCHRSDFIHCMFYDSFRTPMSGRGFPLGPTTQRIADHQRETSLASESPSLSRSQ
jgi:hypothetical protein